ncbi:MAG: Lrp/AsnC family transcriptional regulator [Candidatus Woesearchaeota archaeon]|nr:Lrp/AsnC family transcriptional regulator [Candidatus Woesearchaeota archaeon]
MRGRIEQLDALPKVDARDKKILELLSKDGRMPFSAIAKQVRLARDTVDYRVKRLQKHNILNGFIPHVNLHSFGYMTYHVFMIINTLNEERKQALLDALIQHPNTRSVMEYHDTWDLEWAVIAKDIREFDIIVSELTKDFSDIVRRKDELTIIKGYKSVQLPGTPYEHYARDDQPQVKNPEKTKIDTTDMDLLNILTRNARLSTYEIGQELQVSADKVAYRMKRLKEHGVIYGFTSAVNLSALGYHWYTFSINLRTMDTKKERLFTAFIRDNEHVLRAVKIMGHWDILIYILADSSGSFHTTFKQIQEKLSAETNEYHIWMAYKEHIFNPLPPVIAKSV